MMFRMLVSAIALSGSAMAFTSPSMAFPSSAVIAASSQSRVALEEIQMGRGDKRTAKGKRKAKSFGVSRPRGGKLRKLKEERAAADEN
mmetsp:Transcript_25706/g.65332  ORF Transcript_25706/g.65332 Transcript_25706/m.65332 type:complete len:88 (+) Transcript_25706:49-312(+)